MNNEKKAEADVSAIGVIRPVGDVPIYPHYNTLFVPKTICNLNYHSFEIASPSKTWVFPTQK